MAFNPKGRKLDKNGAPIVSKKELEDSGMSLRDFLNKERGLKPRVRNEDLEPPHVDAESGMTRGTRPKQANNNTEEGMRNYSPRRAPVDMTEVTKPGTRTNYENEEAFKRGGSVKSSASRRGDGIATKGKTRGKLC